jgi:hypothetical protein
VKEGELPKVVVLRDDREPVVFGVLPDTTIWTATHPRGLNMFAGRKLRLEQINQPRTEILVEQKLHAAGGTANLRSRAAANTRHARMSSCVRLGKSARICDSVIPPARYSRMSYTVMRVPRIQGLPPRMPGVIVIRSSSFISFCTRCFARGQEPVLEPCRHNW